MGTFLSLSGVVGSRREDVERAVRSFALKQGGNFEAAPELKHTTSSSEITVINTAGDRTLVLYPSSFEKWDAVSAHISAELGCAAFSFHIHDGDLWMFILFRSGAEMAWFNPRPDYWGDISDGERKKWAGEAAAICAAVPGLPKASIERYFLPWSEDLMSTETKAYPDDEWSYGIDWQMVDFMRRLGFVYPIKNGEIIGTTYRLYLPRVQSSPR